MSRLVALGLAASLAGCAGNPSADRCADGICDEGGDASVVACPSLDKAWNVGLDCAAEPEIQVERLDADTFVLRQSLCTSFEAPFLYLLFGQDRALLFDTGAGGIDVVRQVDEVVAARLAERGQAAIPLVVVNSHGHGDHVAGNPAFAQRPDTKVVGFTVPALRSFFELSSWPGDAAVLDLGGRALDVLPIPGHQGADLALYDRRTGLLLTGDTVYPGRLFIRDFTAFRASIHRLADFTADRPLCAIAGAHIEMTQTAGVDFEEGAERHPAEHALGLGREQLVELAGALDAMTKPRREVHDDFVIFPL
jgi:glyoxylase-like metal-dependent hydrolase (beta-lactamase superfamily II)